MERHVLLAVQGTTRFVVACAIMLVWLEWKKLLVMLAVEIHGILGYKPAGLSLGSCGGSALCPTVLHVAWHSWHEPCSAQRACSRTLCWTDTLGQVFIECMIRRNLSGSGSKSGRLTFAVLCFELDWYVAAYVGNAVLFHVHKGRPACKGGLSQQLLYFEQWHLSACCAILM